jgi:hypothetical protein
MKRLLAFLPVLAASASAMPCSSTQYDMLTWFALGSSLSQQSHLTGNANPLYTYRGNGVFYWLKGASGYPWDVNYYDNNYICQSATEYKWTDPTSYKSFNSTTTMPWSPRCVEKPASASMAVSWLPLPCHLRPIPFMAATVQRQLARISVMS